jgi:hypothetical protein
VLFKQAVGKIKQCGPAATHLTLLKSRHERELVTSRLVTKKASPQIVVVAARVVR